MLYPNGQLPASILVRVERGMILRETTAIAYRNAQKLAALMWNQTMMPAGKYGAGYRDMEAMRVFYAAAHGDRAAMAKAGIDPGLQITVAAPPNSSHAQADRADILFDHHTPNGDQSALLNRCGWSREFGARDVNHWKHDGHTFGTSEEDRARVVAQYLNGRHLGRQTNTIRTGNPDEDFVWLLQTAGRRDGIYPAPLKIDGDWTPVRSTRTRNVLYPHYWRVLWASS